MLNPIAFLMETQRFMHKYNRKPNMAVTINIIH